MAFLEVDGPHHYYFDPPRLSKQTKQSKLSSQKKGVRNSSPRQENVKVPAWAPLVQGVKRLRRKDLMKEALYKRKYPGCSFTRIRYDQVSDYLILKRNFL